MPSQHKKKKAQARIRFMLRMKLLIESGMRVKEVFPIKAVKELAAKEEEQY